MATSGTTNFSVNRDDLIKSALRVLGVLSEGETPSAQQINEGSQALNMLVKHMQSDGIHLFKYAEAVVLLPKNTNSFTLSLTGDNACLLSDFIKTEVATAQTSGQTTLEVDSGTGIAASDIIGIELDDGSLQFTTVSSVSTNTITLADALTNSVAIDNHVYTYTTKLDRPLRVHNARVVQDGDTETPITMVSKKAYFQLPNKLSDGYPTQVYYDPQIDAGELYVWPENDDVKRYLRITVSLPFDDFDNAANTPDFPQEWYRTLKFLLARDLAPEYGIFGETLAYVSQLAERAYQDSLDFDIEPTTIEFVPSQDEVGGPTEGWD